jgi:hypothetical protein
MTWLYSNVSGSKPVQPTRAAQDNVSVMSAEVRAKIEVEILRTFLFVEALDATIRCLKPRKPVGGGKP